MDYYISGLAQRLRTGMTGGHEDTRYTSKRLHGARSSSWTRHYAPATPEWCECPPGIGWKRTSNVEHPTPNLELPISQVSASAAWRSECCADFILGFRLPCSMLSVRRSTFEVRWVVFAIERLVLGRGRHVALVRKVKIGTTKGTKSVLHRLAHPATARHNQSCAQLEFQSTVCAASATGACRRSWFRIVRAFRHHRRSSSRPRNGAT